MKLRNMNNFIKLFLTFMLIFTSGCLNTSVHWQTGISIEIPIRSYSTLAEKYFPALENTKARNSLIDCLADKGEKNIISDECYKAFDFYEPLCFDNPSLFFNKNCMALLNVVMLTDNSIALKRLLTKTNSTLHFNQGKELSNTTRIIVID